MISELELNTVFFYFNPRRPDCKLISRVLLRLEKDYPSINFFQIDLEGNSSTDYEYPILQIIDTLSKRVYRYCYANVESLLDLVDRLETSQT